MTACLGDDFKNAVAKKVRKLVVGDISPLPLRDGDWDIPQVVNALLLLDQKLPSMTTRAEADHFLQPYIPSLEVRGFLLSNLTKNESPNRKGVFDWKFNLNAVANNLNEIADFPHKTESIIRECQELGKTNITNLPWTPYDKPVLFLKGEKSPLINISSPRTLEILQTFFPNHQIYQFNQCGHWIHAEKYNEFYQKMVEFLIKDP